jgi:hypothetical protein
MPNNRKKINVGSPEKPVWVPQCALSPETPEGNRWWGKVASGSVAIGPEHIGRIEKEIKRSESEKG